MPDEAQPVAEPQTGGNVTPPLDVKDAVRIAMEYFKELFGNPFLDLSLEEVQKGTQGQWIATSKGASCCKIAIALIDPGRLPRTGECWLILNQCRGLISPLAWRTGSVGIRTTMDEFEA